MIGEYFLAFGFIIIVIGIIMICKDKLTSRWVKTSGVIISSEYKSKLNSDPDGGRYKTFMTSCKYEYFLQNSNKSMIGTKIFPFGGNSWTTNGEEQLNIYRRLNKGNKIKVYYHPHNQSKSCLVVGKNYNITLIPFIGILLFLLGLGMYIQNLSERNIPERLIESIEAVK